MLWQRYGYGSATVRLRLFAAMRASKRVGTMAYWYCTPKQPESPQALPSLREGTSRVRQTRVTGLRESEMKLEKKDRFRNTLRVLTDLVILVAMLTLSEGDYSQATATITLMSDSLARAIASLPPDARLHLMPYSSRIAISSVILHCPQRAHWSNSPRMFLVHEVI